MATNTTNFDLVKPAGSDNYDIDSFHNGSMDKIDSALQGLGTGLAIISKNNTHGAISSGEYVYVHGHGSLAEGLYKANTNIAANGTLTSSNLTAASGGLGAQVASLSNQIANLVTTQALDISGATFDGTARELTFTITRRTGYKAYIIGINPSNFNKDHFISFWNQPDQSTGVFYVEHNLSTCTEMYAFILWIPA